MKIDFADHNGDYKKILPICMLAMKMGVKEFEFENKNLMLYNLKDRLFRYLTNNGIKTVSGGFNIKINEFTGTLNFSKE